MQAETCQASTVPEAGEGEFVSVNDAKTGQRDWQGMSMKQRNAEQCQREKNEIERDSEKENRFSQCVSRTAPNPGRPPLRCMRDTASHRFHIKICDLQSASAVKPMRAPPESGSARLCRDQFQSFLVPV